MKKYNVQFNYKNMVDYTAKDNKIKNIAQEYKTRAYLVSGAIGTVASVILGKTLKSKPILYIASEAILCIGTAFAVTKISDTKMLEKIKEELGESFVGISEG